MMWAIRTDKNNRKKNKQEVIRTIGKKINNKNKYE